MSSADGDEVPASVFADAGTVAPKPAPGVETPQEYLQQLSVLRVKLGLSYAQIARAAGKGLSRSTTHAMLTKDELPVRRRVELFLYGCNLTVAARRAWLHAYDDLAERISNQRQPVVLMSALRANRRGTRHQATDSQSRAPHAPIAPSKTWPKLERTSRRVPWWHSRTVWQAVLISTVVASGTGGVLLMRAMHMPTDVILALLGIAAMCVMAWAWVWSTSLAVAKRNYQLRMRYVMSPDFSRKIYVQHLRMNGEYLYPPPPYLVEPDPEAVFGTDDMTAPPTIGE